MYFEDKGVDKRMDTVYNSHNKRRKGVQKPLAPLVCILWKRK